MSVTGLYTRSKGTQSQAESSPEWCLSVVCPRAEQEERLSKTETRAIRGSNSSVIIRRYIPERTNRGQYVVESPIVKICAVDTWEEQERGKIEIIY